LYGHHPQHSGVDAPSPDHNVYLNSSLQGKSLIQQLIKQHLLRSQRKMKLQADKKLPFHSFKVGDNVY
jgi:hypothetical protein